VDGWRRWLPAFATIYDIRKAMAGEVRQIHSEVGLRWVFFALLFGQAKSK
jgi:hypothetical protein